MQALDYVSELPQALLEYFVKSAHGIYASEAVNAQDRELTSQILAATGLTIWVDSEAQIDAVTAVSG